MAAGVSHAQPLHRQIEEDFNRRAIYESQIIFAFTIFPQFA